MEIANPESPREWDNLGHMICWHRLYNLGDEHNYADPDQFLFELAYEVSHQERFDQDPAFVDDESLFDRAREVIYERAVILPLYLFDHSGLFMSTSTEVFAAFDPYGFDWGQVGYIYVTREEIMREWEAKRLTKQLRAKAERVLLDEVSAYNDYLVGNVLYYEVEKEETIEDSCYGRE